MDELKKNFLRKASRYIWWKNTEEALLYPQRILAQVMNIGLWEDLCELVRLFSQQQLIEVLQHAEIGQFNERSWAFWHYRLCACPLHGVPRMPQRVLE